MLIREREKRPNNNFYIIAVVLCKYGEIDDY